MKKILSPIAAVVALSLAPAAAWADVQDRSGGYAVGGLGKTKTEAHGKKIDLNQGKQKVGTGKFNYTVGGGYRFNDHFAVETNVHGQAGNSKKKSSRNGSKDAKSNGEVGSLNTRAYTVSGLVIMPVGERVELFGRAGVGRMNTSFTPTAGSAISKARSSGMATQFGAGANFHVGENSFVRTEWTTLRGKGNAAVAKALGRNKLVSSGVMVSYGHNF